MAIKVGLYKMDERSISRLRIVFKMVFKGRCIISNLDESETVIIDSDNVQIMTVLEEFKSAYPGKPVVLLCDKFIEIDEHPCLERPCKLPELLGALKFTCGLTNDLRRGKNTFNKAHQTANALQNKKLPKLQNTRSVKIAHLDHEGIYYDPKQFLQGKVIAAIEKVNKQKKSMFLRIWSHRWVLVIPGSDYLIENIKESQITNLGLVSIESVINFKEEAYTEKQMTIMSDTPVEDIKATSIQKFVWDISVRTARGRIPEGVVVDEYYVLEKWPNLTRLIKIPNAMRISAFWLDQPQSINAVAEKLNIPREDVYTFFSAATATDLLKKAKRHEDNLLIPEIATVEKKKRTIISAILHHFNAFTNRTIKNDNTGD